MGCTPNRRAPRDGRPSTTSKIMIGGMGKWPKIKIWNLLLQVQ